MMRLAMRQSALTKSLPEVVPEKMSESQTSPEEHKDLSRGQHSHHYHDLYI